MEISNSNISFKDLQTPANYAIENGFSRQYVYKMIDKGLVDYVLVDGVKFVVKSKKGSSFTKK